MFHFNGLTFIRRCNLLAPPVSAFLEAADCVQSTSSHNRSNLLSCAHEALESAERSLLQSSHEDVDVIFPDRSMCSLQISTLKADCRLKLGDLSSATRILELVRREPYIDDI